MLTRWDDLAKTFAWMNEFRRQFDQAFEGMGQGWFPREQEAALSGGWPRVNLFDVESKLVFQAELPGFAENDVTLTVHQDVVTFAGERKVDVPEGYSVHRQERAPFKFSRSFKMPAMVNAEKVKASMKNGILTVEMEKSPESQPKQITIKATN